jgi:hypothetical protein
VEAALQQPIAQRGSTERVVLAGVGLVLGAGVAAGFLLVALMVVGLHGEQGGKTGAFVAAMAYLAIFLGSGVAFWWVSRPLGFLARSALAALFAMVELVLLAGAYLFSVLVLSR